MLHQRIHAHGEARDGVHHLARTELASQPVVRGRHVEQQRFAPFHGGSERLVGFCRRIDQEELDAALGHRLGDGAGDLLRRLHGDALEHEIGVEHPCQRRRLVGHNAPNVTNP